MKAILRRYRHRIRYFLRGDIYHLNRLIAHMNHIEKASDRLFSRVKIDLDNPDRAKDAVWFAADFSDRNIARNKRILAKLTRQAR